MPTPPTEQSPPAPYAYGPFARISCPRLATRPSPHTHTRRRPIDQERQTEDRHPPSALDCAVTISFSTFEATRAPWRAAGRSALQGMPGRFAPTTSSRARLPRSFHKYRTCASLQTHRLIVSASKDSRARFHTAPRADREQDSFDNIATNTTCVALEPKRSCTMERRSRCRTPPRQRTCPPW